MDIQSKLPNTGQTIFTLMSNLAQKHHAINLGQGFPDFDINPALAELVAKSVRDGNNQYAPGNGTLVLREAISEKVLDLYKTNIDPTSQVCVTPGATYAIYTALTTVLRPGDEVIVFEPAYDSYIPNILINNATPVLIPLSFPDYKIDWELVKEKITPSTRMIILNSPHNPTGSVINKMDIEALRQIVKDSKIILLSDEVYEHVTFDGKEHESLLKYPDLLERSFVVFSFGKIYHCTGWKLGYCIAPKELMKEFLTVHQYNAFCCNSVFQPVFASFLKHKNEYLKVGSFLQQKRDFFLQLMEQTRFKPLPSFGTYFQLYSYAKISELDELTFAKKLTREAGVATIPVSSFYMNGCENQVLRFCFSKKEETLQKAVDRLSNL